MVSYKTVTDKRHKSERELVKPTVKHHTMANDFSKNCLMNKYMPVKFNKVRRIIAIGDIHGDMEVALKLLTMAKVIEIKSDFKIPSTQNTPYSFDNVEWCGGDTYVVQTGDQLDSCRQGSAFCYRKDRRGDASKSDIHVVHLFTELDAKAQKDGGRVISLLGNHEVNNVINNLESTSQDDIEYFGSKENRANLFKPGNSYSNYLGCTRLLFVSIGSNFFCHGGLVKPFIEKIRKDNESPQETLERLNNIFRKWLITGEKDDSHNIDLTAAQIDNLPSEQKADYKLSILWDRILGNIKPGTDAETDGCRDHFLPIMEMLKMRNMIIGHTPQIFIGHDSINGTCDKRLWRIDNALSDAFDELKKTVKTNKSHKRYQVLEIKNDLVFNVITSI